MTLEGQFLKTKGPPEFSGFISCVLKLYVNIGIHWRHHGTCRTYYYSFNLCNTFNEFQKVTLAYSLRYIVVVVFELQEVQD